MPHRQHQRTAATKTRTHEEHVWRHSARCSVASAVVVMLAAGVPEQGPAVHAVLERVADELMQYYKRAQSVICVEKATVQPIGTDLSPRGFGRVTEYELRLEPDDGDPEHVQVARQLLRVNGRPPRARDATD